MARAVVHAEKVAEKWQRCGNSCRTLAGAESRVDTCADANAERFADALADIRAVFRAEPRAVVRADDFAESGVRWGKYDGVYCYCIISIHFFSLKVQNGTDAESRAEFFAETCAEERKKCANAVYCADECAEKFAPMQKSMQIEKS